LCCRMLGFLDPGCDLLIEFVKSASRWAREVREWGQHFAQAGTQETVIDSGEEQGRAQAEVGEAVTVLARDALDEAVRPQPTQMVGHLSGG